MQERWQLRWQREVIRPPTAPAAPLHRDQRTIVLRLPHFREHDAHFILRWDPPATSPKAGSAGGGAVEYVCLRVPEELRSKHWARLLSAHSAALTDQLVLHESQASPA